MSSHTFYLAVASILWLLPATVCVAQSEPTPPESDDATTTSADCYESAMCGPSASTWIRADALLWWTNGADSPPLLATGILNDPTTTVLFGDDPLNAGMRPGIRLRAGMWSDCEQSCGWEGSVFWLGSDGDDFTASSPDGSNLFRPLIDADTGTPLGQPVPGTTTISTGSNMVGVDLLRRCNWCCECECDCCDACVCDRTCVRRDFLIGFRYLHFSDRLAISEALSPSGPFIVPGTTIDLDDEFRSYNNFYGLKLGLALERDGGPWSFEARPMLSLGMLHRQTKIRGQTNVAVPTLPVQQSMGGLYALSSNIGDYSSQQFAVVPELELNVGYQIRPNLKLLVGYSLIFIPDVQRAAEQIDSTINLALVPPVVPPVTGPDRPSFLNQGSDLWVQGLNLGLEWRF